MNFKSLKIRILFWFGSLTFLLLLLFSFTFCMVFQNSIDSKIKSTLFEEALILKTELLKTPNFDINDYNLKKAFKSVLIKNNIGINNSNKNDVKKVLAFKKTDSSFTQIYHMETIEAYYSLSINEDTTIVVFQDNIDNKIEDIIESMLIIEPLLLIILIFIASKLIDKILIPINEISTITKEISINNFSKTISDRKNNDEIKRLVDSFNDMIIRLRDGVSKLDRFNNDVSHELRTPLTVIRGEIDVTLREKRSAEYYIDTLNTISYESKQIETIVENLLLLTKYSSFNIEETYKICNLDSIILNIIYKFESKYKDKNINLIINKFDSVVINANEQLLTQIISNLIDNAFKYSEDNKNIFIELSKADKINFLLEDEGIGISKENLLNIFDRFYRVDKSRNKKVDGFGLGLSIVKNSVDMHNWEINVNSILNKGTKVEVIF